MATKSAANPMETPTAMVILSLCDNPPPGELWPCESTGEDELLEEASVGDGILEEAIYWTLGEGCGEESWLVGLVDMVVTDPRQTNAADPIPLPVTKDKQSPTFPLLVEGERDGFLH